MRELTQNDLKNNQIRTYHNQMDNGEMRFRLISDEDNSSYIRTHSYELGGLQNSHYHKFFSEMYIVQKGKIKIYEYTNEKVITTILNEGEYYKIEKNTPHNAYMYPFTITHTIKFGKSPDSDWYPFEKLDELLNKD